MGYSEIFYYTVKFRFGENAKIINNIVTPVIFLGEGQR